MPTFDQIVEPPAGDPFTPTPPPIHVTVRATDQISRLGLVNMLAAEEGIEPIPNGEQSAPHAVVVAAVSFDAKLADVLRQVAHQERTPLMLVINEITDQQLCEVAAGGAAAAIPRHLASGPLLARTLRALLSTSRPLPAEFAWPQRPQIREFQETASSQPDERHDDAGRETAVLELVAEGRQTTQIADALGYSESTVKNIVYDFVTRFDVSDRTHAVAHTIGEGLT